MRLGVLGALAIADFRERVRRPAYLAILVSAIGLGYLAAPAVDGRWVILNAGNFRGVYDSAYVGTVTALAGMLWLTLGGFYVVRNAVARDEQTRVGQLLAATPLRMATYLAGKWLSNLLVFGSMLLALAGTALVMQMLRGESRAVDPVALVLPFVLIALPVLAVAAAAAVFFETVRPLRGGFGNVVWFFGWLVFVFVGQGSDALFGGLGIGEIRESMRADIVAQHGGRANGEFALGLMYLDHPLRTFEWSGLDLSAGFVGGRIVFILFAVVLAMLGALWFGRFDPARGRLRVRPGAGAVPPGLVVASPGTAPVPPGLVAASPGTAVPRRPAAYGGLPRGEVRRGATFGRLCAGELRILARGGSRWWWLGVAALTVVSLLVPVTVAATPLLLLVWVWPILVWSRLGTQRHENGVAPLLGAYPLAHRRFLAEWAAGVGFTALVGLGPVLRLAMAADWPGVAAWAGGAVFIPSLALVLGLVSRTSRFFQAIYLPLWFLLVNGVAAVDYLGAVRVDGQPAGPSPLLVGGVSLVLLTVGFAVETARQARR
ncbi:hypothetical protein GCM10027280_04370 [Micromonospora polyrhachis]|uniref:ABC-2 family transporter protein n=1 Tax=Micromonospora polyrhachis TaxID=1282883 RepID=A0A7W7SM04_9ACTN|nr:hypothetical protein [Micromonospora polyrhachis]MBB4957263.1 hypothetical protein [Micromonospora polyrhachis]